jgi:hypothetical protein
MQPLYWYWEKEIPADICQEIIDTYFIESNVEEGMFDTDDKVFMKSDDYRITDVTWAKTGTKIFDTLFHYIQSANKEVWNYDISGMESVQMGRYRKGGHYEWHSDADDPCPENYQRKLSCSFQLSDEDSYEGGDLVFKKANQEEIIAPRKQGSIIVFPSNITHKVTPVTAGVRFSAVAWMRGARFK